MTTTPTDDTDHAASSAVFYLRQRRVLRVWLVSQLLVQLVFYVAFAGLAIQGLTSRDEAGDLARPGDITTGIIGLLVVLGLAILRSYILLQPPLRVDPDGRAIKARLGSWPQPPLTFDEAEAMELRTKFGRQLHLFGPLEDRKGKIDPRGRYPLNLTGRSERPDGGAHRLAPLLPAPLATLDDGVVLADPARWSVAVRLALFLNVRKVWRAEADAPDPLGRHGSESDSAAA
ncbi:MAG: hypothetical protein AAFO29_03565 [Actinomycetota bacterium]